MQLYVVVVARSSYYFVYPGDAVRQHIFGNSAVRVGFAGVVGFMNYFVCCRRRKTWWRHRGLSCQGAGGQATVGSWLTPDHVGYVVVAFWKTWRYYIMMYFNTNS